MIHDPLGCIDFDERGRGPTLVLVPGSCSTGAAWRPVMTALGDGFRVVTTSLPGYGGTAERRSESDTSMGHVAQAVEAVVRKAAAPVHLIGHSFGGLVATAVALRGKVDLASLVVLEAPALMLLREWPEDAALYDDFMAMTNGYFSGYASGEREAIGRMIDFYGGAGTFASWPERVRAYAMETTSVNLRDWQTAFGFPLPLRDLAAIKMPCSIAWGGNSHRAAKRANFRLGATIPASRATAIDGAAHFMIATHATEVAAIIAEHVLNAARGRR